MSRRRLLFIPCLSAILIAGAVTSPSRAKTSPTLASKCFALEPTQFRLPFPALPFDTRFEAQGNTVLLLRPEDSSGYGTNNYTDGVLPWSQPLGKTTAFTFQSTPQEVRLKDDTGATVLLLHYDGHPTNQALFVPRSFTLTSEQGNLVVTERGQTPSSKEEAIESEPVPILKLTYSAGQSASDPQNFRSETAVPRTMAPAVPGTYDLTYHDSKGNVLQRTVVTVWKSADGAFVNPLGAPYQVTEYNVDDNGKRFGAGQTYYMGERHQPPQDTTPPERTAPPVYRPSPPPKFRLIQDEEPYAGSNA